MTGSTYANYKSASMCTIQESIHPSTSSSSYPERYTQKGPQVGIKPTTLLLSVLTTALPCHRYSGIIYLIITNKKRSNTFAASLFNKTDELLKHLQEQSKCIAYKMKKNVPAPSSFLIRLTEAASSARVTPSGDFRYGPPLCYWFFA